MEGSRDPDTSANASASRSEKGNGGGNRTPSRVEQRGLSQAGPEWAYLGSHPRGPCPFFNSLLGGVRSHVSPTGGASPPICLNVRKCWSGGESVAEGG